MRIEAILTEDDGLNRRSSRRRALRLSADIVTPATNPSAVVVHNIANGGLLMEARDVALEKGDTILIDLPGQIAVKAEIIWKAEPFFGCQFDGGVSTAQVAAALLKAEPVGRDAAAVEVGANPASPPRRRGQLGPELNFSVAAMLSLFLWLLIAAVFQSVL